MYGFSREEFLGMSLETISRNVEEGRGRVAETMEKGQDVHFETMQYRKDGSEMYLEINAATIDYGGKPAILTINRDITERKLRERDLEAYITARSTSSGPMTAAQEAVQRRLLVDIHADLLQSLDGAVSTLDRAATHLDHGELDQVPDDLARLRSTLAATLFRTRGALAALENRRAAGGDDSPGAAEPTKPFNGTQS
jgi:hypothetical protein